MTAVADALELDRVESHLNPPASYDLADHPVPTGREETCAAGSMCAFVCCASLGAVVEAAI